MNGLCRVLTRKCLLGRNSSEGEKKERLHLHLHGDNGVLEYSNFEDELEWTIFGSYFSAQLLSETRC